MNPTATPFKDFDQLAADMRGRWSYLYSDLAPELDEAMAAAGDRGPARHVSCPVHGGKDGFRLFADYAITGGGVCNTCGGSHDGFKLLSWLKGYSRKDAVRVVGKWDRDEGGVAVVRERPPPKPFVAKDPADAYQRIRDVWLASRPLAGTPAEQYLVNRGIRLGCHSVALRYHPGLRYYCGEQKKSLGVFPCLLAPIKAPDGRLLSVHRIYITREGHKAPVPEVKKMMSPIAELPGAAIRLFPVGPVLGVAEGIETALAAHVASRMPVWSCVNTALLKTFVIPPGVQTLVIWADKDRKPLKGPADLPAAGEAAANRLAERARAQGLHVEVHYPPLSLPVGVRGVDWLDALLTTGLPAFPAIWRQWKEPAVPLAA